MIVTNPMHKFTEVLNKILNFFLYKLAIILQKPVNRNKKISLFLKEY